MGQSYDANSIYINWSHLFDYTSLKTLEASKKLPVPKGITVTSTVNSGADLTYAINIIGQYVNIAEGKLTFNSEQDRIIFLNTFGDAIRQIERNGGQYYYQPGGVNENVQRFIHNLFVRHEHFPIPNNVAEAAYKNVASANIYAVSHDVRNRDQAYTAISMDTMQEAADNSPKGKATASMNMLNPFTKYIMQYQNMVGKGVVGVAANGEKVWFNAYAYWTHLLLNGTEEQRKYLKFSATLSRIQGRSAGTEFDPEKAVRTVTHLPDLNYRNERIKEILENEFGANDNTLNYRYVDVLTSELLSAATDFRYRK